MDQGGEVKNFQAHRLHEDDFKRMQEMFEGVAMKAMQSAMTEDNAKKFGTVMAGIFLDEATNRLREQSKEHASNLVLWSIKAIGARVVAFLFIGGIVYAFGGWDALARVAKFIFNLKS
jgi:hypothetical protein